MSNGREEYTITWFIENYSYCWLNNNNALNSPEFTADGLNSSTWSLSLYPRGQKDYKSHISLHLNRSKSDNGPEVIPLKGEFSILGPDGSVLITQEFDSTFKKGGSEELPRFIQMEEVLVQRKADFLPQDKLCVRCTIWTGEGKIQSVTQFSAVTRIGIEHTSFLHVVEGFSSVKPNEKKTLHIGSSTGTELLSSSMYFSNDLCLKGDIMVEIKPFITDLILTKCEISLLDVSGTCIECCEIDDRFYAQREDIKKVTLCRTRTDILNRKDKYLPNDKLSLLCSCTFVSTNVELQKIERIPRELPLVTLNQNKIINDYAEKLSACANALDDFKTIYNDLLLTDIELKTKTKSFPAHKIVLCARSSVFKAMLNSDMKEKNMDCIKVDDLEDDTVQQLLLFLYSDNLENLQWESALKLYYAGDKYDVERLKVFCSSFLVNSLSTSNASQLLLLADTHNDLDLLKLVEKFILEHEEEVFGSDEWVKISEIDPQLVIKTMCSKYKKKKGGKEA